MLLPEISPAIRLLLYILTVYRMAEALVYDQGPWHLFGRLRQVPALAELTSCPFCCGWWLAFIIFPLWAVTNDITTIILVAMGVAGAQAALERISVVPNA